MSKTLKTVGFSLLAAVIVVYLANLLTLKLPVSNRLEEDERNEDVSISVRYGYYMRPDVLVVALNDSEQAAPVDFLRVLLQTAEELQSRSFSRVELHRGYTHKFSMGGSYFQELGEEYEFQNPVYTARTLPEELRKPDGSQAYHNFGSGLFGIGEEMETFNEFARDWHREE
jgi:hypothetical protein